MSSRAQGGLIFARFPRVGDRLLRCIIFSDHMSELPRAASGQAAAAPARSVINWRLLM